jgi:hypothetical protein
MIYLLSLLFSLLPFSLWSENEAEIVFAGDAMQHQAQIDAARQPNGTYNYDECFAEIKMYAAIPPTTANSNSRKTIPLVLKYSKITKL